MFVEARLSIDDLAFFSPSPFLSLHPILSLSLCVRSENFLLEDDVSELTRPIPNVDEIKRGKNEYLDTHFNQRISIVRDPRIIAKFKFTRGIFVGYSIESHGH